MKQERILEALAALPVETVDNDAFFWVGHVLKKEGLPCSVWEQWARGDRRYRPGLCEAHWHRLDPEKCGLDGRYIVHLAQLAGRLPPDEAPPGAAEPEEERALSLSERSAREDALYAEAAAEDLRRAALWQREQEECDYDGLPYTETLDRYRDAPPEPPEALIGGLLRKGHKMLLSGPSKAGKSFLLMELCVAIAEGLPWLGFPCQRGRVMYVNLEIDPTSAIRRFLAIYKALGVPPDHMGNIVIWNLRGHSLPMDQLTWPLIRRVNQFPCDAVVVDPVYKVLTGDENSAAEMARLGNQFDRVCAQTGSSVIFCHHHSKGAQAGKKAADRASGSGVFARDPDAQLDVIELDPDERQRALAKPGATGWRLEASLREFPPIPPRYFWYEYPLHRPDEEGLLKEAAPCGEGTGRRSTPQLRQQKLTEAFAACQHGGAAALNDLALHAQVNARTMRDWVEENGDTFWLDGKTVREKRQEAGQG